jgi:hypothetical protein
MRGFEKLLLAFSVLFRERRESIRPHTSLHSKDSGRSVFNVMRYTRQLPAIFLCSSSRQGSDAALVLWVILKKLSRLDAELSHEVSEWILNLLEETGRLVHEENEHE